MKALYILICYNIIIKAGKKRDENKIKPNALFLLNHNNVLLVL